MSRTKEQNENLLKLANHLESLPEDYEHFSMADFISYDDDTMFYIFPEDVKDSETLSNCGTVACAVGHGPFVGIKPLKGEGWMTYSERVFTKDRQEWEWCFDGCWEDIDNTPHGAAKRIKILLKRGLPDFDIYPDYLEQYEYILAGA